MRELMAAAPASAARRSGTLHPTERTHRDDVRADDIPEV